MSDYLELHCAIDPKIVGVRDGLGAANVGASFYEKNHWYCELFGGEYATFERFQKWATLPDHGQPMLDIPLRKRGKLTDLVQGGLLFGYLVSDKLRSLLEQHNLPRHRYFEATFTRDEQVFGGYWWLVYDLEQGQSTVDFAQSEFDFSWHVQEFGHDFAVTSYQEYVALSYVTGRTAPATKVVFNDSFDRSLDLWGPQFLSVYRGYISGRLLQAFQQHNITGFQVREPRRKLIFS